MDKTALKNFAINSRKKLIEDTKYRLNLLGITENEVQEPIEADGMQSFHLGGTIFSIYDEDILKRKEIIKEIENKGFNNFVEEVAYTWFNRIIAIRYMEVNNYLPTKVRVLSSETKGKIDPDILTYALEIDLDYTDDDKELIMKLKREERLDELFRFLFIKQCNKLNDILPGLFEKTDDYMELLLNIKFADENSVVRQLVDTIPEEDFGNQVEIIGWLYQFYNIELKDETFANLKKKIKISKERIPAATQLFTPDWIVKYMVENSVGRLWLEGHPNENLKSKWKYFVEESEQEHEVELKLAEIRKESSSIKPEDIKVIDPCCGSGHVLLYVFDVLMQIYVSEGFTEKDAAEYILNYNLYGIDIDDRAYQLSYFAVLMKARKFNKNILNKNIKPLVCSIQESNNFSDEFKRYVLSKCSDYKNELEYIFNSFHDAKEYGSILQVKNLPCDEIIKSLNDIKKDKSDLNVFHYEKELIILENILSQAKFLSNKFDIVITNPPYMGNSGMNQKLKDFLKSNYPNSKSDLFAVFIERCNQMTNTNGLFAMITQQSFMFLSTFEKLRMELIKKSTIIDMAHLGARAFDEIGGEVVQATTFVQRKIFIENYISTFHRLISFNSEKYKEEEFFNHENLFFMNQSNFNMIPGCPIAYWVSDDFINIFNFPTLEEYSEIITGMTIGKNDLYLRLWYEVEFNKISLEKNNMSEIDLNKNYWIPYNKGGKRRNWYGNNEYIVNWAKKDNFNRAKTTLERLYLRKGLTWSFITSGKFSMRYFPEGFLWDVSGSPAFFDDEKLMYYSLGFLCTNFANTILEFLNPTINVQAVDLKKIPLIYDEINAHKIIRLVKENISISYKDWNEYETSWDFNNHPLIDNNTNNKIEKSHENYMKYKKNNFELLKSNEICLNKLFSQIYSVDFNINIPNKDITLTCSDLYSNIKSFISYAVGCMFGRYSLDNGGLQFTGGEFDINNYSKFIPDEDNIIPILDTGYFEDDIVGRFVEFVKTCFGEEHLEENLDFIADALSNNSKPSREKIRDYLVKNFFNDHVKTYKKCPIYWQFSSGKENGFNCLVYLHRYEPSLVARIRTEYLHKVQRLIEQAIDNCENIINHSSSNSEKNKATKEKGKLQKQLKETQEYDEALAHIANQNIEIDLDDGVKINYAKFQNVEVSREGSKTKKINLLKKI